MNGAQGGLSTTAETIAALGVSKVRLNELARKGKIPRGPAPNQWDITAIRESLGRNLDIHQQSPARGELPPGTIGHQSSALEDINGSVPRGTLAAAQLMKTQAQADQEVMVAKKMDGSLVDAAAVMQALSDMVATAKTRLLGIGNKLAPALAAESEPAKIQAAIEAEVYEALTDLSRWRLA